MLNYTVLSQVHFFQSPRDIPGIFESFFNGLFLIKGLPIFFQLGFLISIMVCIFAAIQFSRDRRPIWERVTAVTAFSTLAIASFLLFQPWDELFIYLRHSEHLANAGNFSFNQNEKIEGIVDFLPFFSLGLLHKLGLPLLETNFIMEILAGWFCILGGRRILNCLKVENSNVWAYPILVLYPPLLLNAGSGFSFLFFTGFIVWSLVLLVFSPPSKSSWFLGCLILSMVPIVRLEGIWFCLLLTSFTIFSNQVKLSKKAVLLGLILVFSPTVLLSVWRFIYFGSILPIPIIYKSSVGSVFFTLIGLRNLLMDLIASGSVFFCFIILVWHISGSHLTKSLEKQKGYKVFWLLALFSAPYYLSGGDWFPPALGRYLFALSFFSFIFFVSIIFETLSAMRKISPFISLFLGILFLTTLSFPFASLARLKEWGFSHKTSLSGMNLKKAGKGNYRIEYLSRLGHHFKDTTSPETVIGSSEIATIMFTAKREALDLLGVTNMAIAQSPLRKTPLLFSKIKKQNELPHLIFKRIKPDLLFEKRPGIFYAFDFILKDLLNTESVDEVTEVDLWTALKRWERNFLVLNDTLFGGLKALEKNQYEPVLVKYGTDFFALYFVSKEAKEDHFLRMRNAGLVQSVLRNKHL